MFVASRPGDREAHLEVMKEVAATTRSDPPRRGGSAALQRYLNFWFSSSRSISSVEVSSNAASTFADGIRDVPTRHQYKTRLPDDFRDRVRTQRRSHEEHPRSRTP